MARDNTSLVIYRKVIKIFFSYLLDPCFGINCGSVSVARCEVENGKPICRCNNGFKWISDAKECHQCIQKPDCLPNQICINNKCVNLCEEVECGSKNGAHCVVEGFQAICKCNRGFKWFSDTKECHECLQHSDCLSNNICNDKKCVNPCQNHKCGTQNGARCEVENFKAVCKCNPGFKWFFTMSECYQCLTDADCSPGSLCNEKKCIVNPCQNIKCGTKNGARCEVVNLKATCKCGEEFKWFESVTDCFECLDNTHCSSTLACQQNKCTNPCEGYNCGLLNGARCEVEERKPVCKCNYGFKWFSNVKECLQCLQHSDCSPNSFCLNKKCINPCEHFNCGSRNGARCQVENFKAVCKCNYGFRWFSSVNDCASTTLTCRQNKCIDPCNNFKCGTKNGARCEVVNRKATCKCNQGFKWFRSVTDCHECLQHSDCSPNTYCFDRKCIDPCKRLNCGSRNGARCEVVNRKPICKCSEGFKWFESVTDCHECLNNAHCSSTTVCQQNKCTNPCVGYNCGLLNGARCEVKERKPVCKCNHGFKWFSDATECHECLQHSDCLSNNICSDKKCVNLCQNHKCGSLNGAHCVVEENKPLCKCGENFKWFSDINECHECLKNSDCPVNHVCTDRKCVNLCDGIFCGFNNGARCAVENFEPVCKCYRGYKWFSSLPDCYECLIDTDCPSNFICSRNRCINLCQNYKCGLLNGAKCVMENRRPICKCDKGFKWFGNKRECHECLKNFDCRQNEKCINFGCVNLCHHQNCTENSKCVAENGRFYCQCNSGLKPNREGKCETFDPCEDAKCPQYSRCYRNNGEAECKCINGFAMDNFECKFGE